MPLVKVECTGKIQEEKKKKIAAELSKICSDIMRKPEAYVMSIVGDGFETCMAGETAECAFVEVKGIGGFSPDVNRKLSSAICDCINKELSIKPSCVYINFTDISPVNWGWDGKTFG